MTSRRSSKPHSVRLRSRPYVALVNPHDSNTSNTRQAIATPAKGKRIRVLRVTAIQEISDGRHLYEVYLGLGADITTNPDKAVDVLDIPDLGQDRTRTYLKDEGPRGDRDEVLSGRWRGTPPTTVHKIMVEYTEES